MEKVRDHVSISGVILSLLMPDFLFLFFFSPILDDYVQFRLSILW